MKSSILRLSNDNILYALMHEVESKQMSDEEKSCIRINTDSLQGGSPAEDAIKDIFLKGGSASVNDEMQTNTIEEPEQINGLLQSLHGGANENEDQVRGIEENYEEIDPEDLDGKEELEKDGDGEILPDDIEQPNNDNTEKDEDEPELETDVYDSLIKASVDINNKMEGGATNFNKTNVVIFDSKFPWILKSKSKIE